MTESADINVIAQAQKAITQGQFSQALSLGESLDLTSLSLDSTIEFHYLQAVAHRYLQNYQSAQQSLDALFILKSDHARAHQEKGHLFLAQKRTQAAAKAFYDATLINPALVGSWRALVTLYQSEAAKSALAFARENLTFWNALPKPLLAAADMLFSGNIEKAGTTCRAFLQEHKHHAQGLYLLALVDIQAKAFDEAEFLLDSCCVLSPEHHRARAEYAALLNRIGKFHSALAQANHLLNQSLNDSAEHLSYEVLKAVALVGLGDLPQGIGIFEKVLHLEPRRASLWLQLGHAYKALGELDKCVVSYKKALEYRRDYGDAYWSLANTKAYRFDQNEIRCMKNLLDNKALSTDDRIHIAFALGKGLEDNKQPIDAFGFYAKGNAEKYKISAYKPKQFTQQVERHIDFFSASMFESMGTVGCNDAAPIFIVGLPRSGSTLLEQILSSHSQVDATQELHNILSLAKRLRKQSDYPAMLQGIERKYFERFGQQYIDQTQAYRQDGTYFIDKMPNNFLHIGLIKLILPKAKVIDARRDPLDCCYSGFKQLFAEGQDFTYDLEAIGRYYRDYQRLMVHWDNVLPGFVLRVQHEDVLDDLRGQLRRILDFCELDFEVACLNYYQTQRAVQTPSAAQVRKPINRDGVGRWQAVGSLLTPLKQALEQ